MIRDRNTYGDEGKFFKVTRVGTEPIVGWTRDPGSDLPRFSLLLSNWRFVGRDGCRIQLGDHAMISGTIVADDDEPLVPSSPEPDLDDGRFRIACGDDGTSYTLRELRDIALTETRWRRIRRFWRNP